MAKKDSFFIRANVEADSAGAFNQTEIDLGSFVNLGVKSSTLLRIHNIAVAIQDGTEAAGMTPEGTLYSIVVPGANIAYQLTTETKGDMVGAFDKSVVASGSLTLYGDSTATAHPQAISHHADVLPQHWSNGYLIGVDSMFLGAEVGGTLASGDATVTVIMECTLETATQASATALALSQQ